jgi:hypothetical protein
MSDGMVIALSTLGGALVGGLAVIVAQVRRAQSQARGSIRAIVAELRSNRERLRILMARAEGAATSLGAVSLPVPTRSTYEAQAPAAATLLDDHALEVLARAYGSTLEALLFEVDKVRRQPTLAKGEEPWTLSREAVEAAQAPIERATDALSEPGRRRRLLG